MTAIAFPVARPAVARPAVGRPVAARPAVRRTPVAPGSARPATRLRLTARGRAVLGSLVALPLAAIALTLGLGATGAVATQTPSTVSFEYVTVDAGQSLWDLAAEVAPGVDPREFAAEVVALNQLSTAVLQPGQQLAIPLRYTD